MTTQARIAGVLDKMQSAIVMQSPCAVEQSHRDATLQPSP